MQKANSKCSICSTTLGYSGDGKKLSLLHPIIIPIHCSQVFHHNDAGVQPLLLKHTENVSWGGEGGGNLFRPEVRISKRTHVLVLAPPIFSFC